MDTNFPPAGAKTVPGAAIEIIRDEVKRGGFKTALFDFDGTISVIREGWPEIMIPLMVEELQKCGSDETNEQLHEVALEFVDRLTGKDTIYQMMELCDNIKKRGMEPEDPLVYKKRYLDRLWLKIESRVTGLKEGKIDREQMAMMGAFELLDALKERGIEMYLASGTDHDNVVDEATALGVAPYFGDNIYGAIDNYKDRSKAKIIKDIIDGHGLGGETLLVFGDGFVEIENCKVVGGLAIGMASDEEKRTGLNEWKRNRLIKAGADLILTDFRDHKALLDYLFDY